MLKTLLTSVSCWALLGAANLAANPDGFHYRVANPENDETSAHGVLTRAEQELAFGAAVRNLEYFLQAGETDDVERGAQLMTSFYVNSRYAINETRRLYKKHESLLEDFLSASRDVYGYEFDSNRFGTSVEFEGRLETTEGLVAEYRARMVFKENRWLISSLNID